MVSYLYSILFGEFPMGVAIPAMIIIIMVLTRGVMTEDADA